MKRCVFCFSEDKKRMETFGGQKLHRSAMVPVIYIVPRGNGQSTKAFRSEFLYNIMFMYACYENSGHTAFTLQQIYTHKY